MPGTGDKKESKIGSISIGSPRPSVGTRIHTHTHAEAGRENRCSRAGGGGGPGSESSTLMGTFGEDSPITGQAKGKNTRQARGKQGECPVAEMVSVRSRFHR